MSLAWRWHGPLPLPALAGGLIEGVAEAAEPADPDEDATIHEEARGDDRGGPGAAAGGGHGRRLLDAGGTARLHDGRIVRTFLLATRGPERLRALYRSAGNFSDVYRVPLADLESEWRQFLARQPLTTRERARASEEFRRPAIFKRVCARELAARLVEARAHRTRGSRARRRDPRGDLPRRSRTSRSTGWRSRRRWRSRASASARW